MKLAGAPLAGASVHVDNNFTALIAAGYYFTDNISAQLTGGWPPSTALTGVGTLAGAGKLGRVTYGPAVASIDYHLTNFGAFRYIGGGVAYSIIFAQSDGAVANLRVQGRFGGVIEGGFDYMLTKNWSLFVDAKKIWLTVGASAPRRVFSFSCDTLEFTKTKATGGNMKRHGSCLCGKITFTLDEENPTIAVCHCTHCQKQTGSAFSLNALAPGSKFHVRTAARRC